MVTTVKTIDCPIKQVTVRKGDDGWQLGVGCFVLGTSHRQDIP